MKGKHWLLDSYTPPTGHLAYNPGMSPDWELNRWPFSSQAGTQSTEPHQPGQVYFILNPHHTSPEPWHLPVACVTVQMRSLHLEACVSYLSFLLPWKVMCYEHYIALDIFWLIICLEDCPILRHTDLPNNCNWPCGVPLHMSVYLPVIYWRVTSCHKKCCSEHQPMYLSECVSKYM